MNSFDTFVGLPWLDRGRTAEGCDCYGLIRLPYLELLGIDLPSHADDYPTTADRRAVEAVIAGGVPDFSLVEGPHKPFDLVLLHERPWHIGIVVQRGWMLHMPEGATSVIEQYTTGRHARRVEGVYRHLSQR